MPIKDRMELNNKCCQYNIEMNWLQFSWPIPVTFFFLACWFRFSLFLSATTEHKNSFPFFQKCTWLEHIICLTKTNPQSKELQISGQPTLSPTGVTSVSLPPATCLSGLLPWNTQSRDSSQKETVNDSETQLSDICSYLSSCPVIELTYC